MNLISTDLIIEEGIPDILRDFRHSLNVTSTFLVALGVSAIAERVALVSDFPESAGRQSARWRAMVDPGHVLEQFRPLATPALLPGSSAAAVLLRAQLVIQPCHNGFQLVLHRRGLLSECQPISRRARQN